MTKTIPEKDWKYLRSIEKELLSDLCRAINRKAAEILNSEDLSEHEKYLTIYRYIEVSDDTIAKCFNDWRRSNICLKLRLLHRHHLLKEEHIANLSDESCNLLSD